MKKKSQYDSKMKLYFVIFMDAYSLQWGMSFYPDC